MPLGWRVFVAVAVSVASQGILAPVAIWWLIRYLKRRASIDPLRHNGSDFVHAHRGRDGA